MQHRAQQVFPVGNPIGLRGCSQMFLQGEARPREPSPSSSSRSQSSRWHRSQAEPGVGVGRRAQIRAGRLGSSTAWHGAPGEQHSTARSPQGAAWHGARRVQPPEQQPRAGPAQGAHRATHGPPQPGGWDSIGEESTGSSSKSQALQELGSLTAGSFKNWILRELDPLSTRSFSEC